MITKLRATLLGLLVSGMFMSQIASAGTFTVTAWAPAGGDRVKVAITGSNPAPRTYDGWGGGFSMAPVAPAGPAFISWCVDLYEYISGSPNSYTQTIGASNISNPALTDLARLATMHLVGATATGSGSGTNAAAFQLSVWEIFYETRSRSTDSTPYDLSDGTFTANGTGIYAGAYSLAQTWLGQVNNPLNSANNYTINSYVSTDASPYDSSGNGKQDQITFVRRPGTGTGDCGDNCDVPEPATLSLLGIGLMGLGFIRRKSAKAARA